MRHIFLFNTIYDSVAQEFVRQLLDLDRESNEEITIFINSRGGSVTAMFAMIDAMRITRSKIRTVVMGMAASAAAVIAAAGDTRFMTENSRFMLHEVWSIIGGSISNMQDNVKEIEKEQDKLLNILARATGKTKEKIKADIQKKDKYFEAKEAKSYGLIDTVLKDSDAQKFKLSETIHGEVIEFNTEDVKEIQLLREGHFEHPEYGPFDLDEAMFDLFIKNFNDNIRGQEISIDFTHDNENGENPAAFWIGSLSKKQTENGLGLFAQGEYTSEGLAKVQDKAYKYLSADFVRDYITNDGAHVPYVLCGGTLTNRPFIKGMEPIKLSERKPKRGEQNKMDRDELFNILKEEHNIDVQNLLNVQEENTRLKDEKKKLEEKLQNLSKLSGSAEKIEELQNELKKVKADLCNNEKETVFNDLISEGKVVLAQKDKIMQTFATAEDIKNFYADQPKIVHNKADGEDGQQSDPQQLTKPEQNLVDKGVYTKEEILANRTVKA